MADAVWERQSSSTKFLAREVLAFRSWSWDGFWRRVTIP